MVELNFSKEKRTWVSRFDLWSRIPILLLDKFSEIRIFEEGEQNGRARFFQGEKNVVSRFDLWSRIPIRLLDKFSEIRIFEEGEQNGRARFFQGEKNVGFRFDLWSRLPILLISEIYLIVGWEFSTKDRIGKPRSFLLGKISLYHFAHLPQKS